MAAAVTRVTKAVLPVHLCGHAADSKIMQISSEHGLGVIEDTAQALGGEWRSRKLGTIGSIGAFSFFPSKNLGGFGDGGLAASGDGDLAERLRALRTHGARHKYQNEMLGYNSRLDEIQAAVLRAKLPHLDAANEGCRRVAATYSSLLGGVDGGGLPVLAPGHHPCVSPVHHTYYQRTPGQCRGGAERSENIDDDLLPVPGHRLPIYSGTAPELPTAERLAGEVLSLPIWPAMAERLIARVARAVTTALSR